MTTRTNPAVILTACGCLMLLSACGPVQTTTLVPDQFETFDKVHSDVAEWACFPFQCFANYWYGACPVKPAPTGGVLAGTKHQYENGTEPCTCWKNRDCFHRGAVHFDLGSLAGKNIVGARLRWTDRGQCASRLFVVTSSWPNWNNPAGMELSDPWPAGSAGPGELEVGPIVRDWTDGDLSNFGFLFVGPEEEERHGEQDVVEGESLLEVCPSAVSGLELEVLYSE